MRTKIFVVALVLLVLPEFVLSQSINLNFIGAGARARGMGGAFIGVADDATASSWNPAGLSRLQKAEASVVGIFESYTPESDVEGFDAEPYQHSHFGLNYASLALPLAVGDRNLVAAVGFHQVIDFYNKYDGEYWESENTGGVNAIMPSIGIQLTPMISLGATVNIYTGSSEYTSKDKSGYYQDEKESEEYSGTNFTLGGLFDFDRFRFGVVYKSGFALNVNDDDDDDVEFNMPNMLGFGVAFEATENLILAADYEMRKFSESTVKADWGEEKLGWEDINQFRVGAEYLLMTGNSILPVRVGFATTPTPFKDDNDDQIVGINLSAGIGLIMGSINLDLAVEYNTFNYEFQTGGSTFDYSDNYLRLIVAGVFHFGK